MYIRIPYCAPGSEMQNPAKLAAIESAIIKAYAARAPGVRTGIHTATMAPSRDPLDWDWSFLDFTVGLCKRYGLKLLLELAYGGVEGECESDCWDSTDQFEPVSTDHEDLAGFYVATVQRFDEEYLWNLRNGDVIFTLWNEPDRTAFGATADGEISADCIDFFNTATVALKTAYPNMLLAAPSLSLIDPRTYEWEALKVGKYEDNFGADLHPFWRLADYLDIHLYNGMDGTVPLGSVTEQRLRTRRAIDAFFEQLSKVPESRLLLEKQCVASEFGKNYFNAGMNNESWEYGGSYQKMRLTMATGLQILRYPQFLIAAYYLVQNETGSDGRSDEQNYGAYLSDGQATFGLDDLTRVGGGLVAADLMTAGD